jgi:hypothetical protein
VFYVVDGGTSVINESAVTSEVMGVHKQLGPPTHSSTES